MLNLKISSVQWLPVYLEDDDCLNHFCILAIRDMDFSYSLELEVKGIFALPPSSEKIPCPNKDLVSICTQSS